MGIFDRIRDVVGGDDRPRPDSDDVGVDRGAGSGRIGGDDRKTGSHGSHWDTVLPDNAAVRDAIVAAVEVGESRDGAPVNGNPVTAHVHPVDGPIRTVALSVDGQVVTAFPVGDGVVRECAFVEAVEWANGVEAQLSLDCRGSRLAVFDTGYFFREPDWYEPGTTYRTDLAAFAYDLGPAAEADHDGIEDPEADVAAYLRFDGGDVDDYVFRTRIGAVEDHAFRGRTVYRIRAPLFRDDGEDVEIAFYAAEGMIDGYRPEPGDDVEGVCWLQGRVV